VPLRFDGRLVGVAKLVVGPETRDRTFSAATRVLTLVVSGICQDSLVSQLSEEVGALRRRVAEFRRIHSAGAPEAHRPVRPVAGAEPGAAQARNSALVDRALSYLHRHYQEPGLSLAAVAEAVGCNPKYLTVRFTHTVGERMHTYLVRHRVAHACGLLTESGLSIKETAYASGFPATSALARAFRRHVGVSPSGYRRIFAGR
jgi:AraC-like DNA-binding protein